MRANTLIESKCFFSECYEVRNKTLIDEYYKIYIALSQTLFTIRYDIWIANSIKSNYTENVNEKNEMDAIFQIW